MRKLILFAVMALCLIADHVDAGMTDYCQTPPFISAAAAPNILLVMDTSGSMGNSAYSSSAYDATKLYEGYFDPAKRYGLIDGVYVETANNACPPVCTGTVTCSSGAQPGGCTKGALGCASNRWGCCSLWTVPAGCDDASGNYLNYMHMTRADLLRWAMTGGKPQGCDGSTQRCDPGFYGQPSANLPCDATGCTLESSDGLTKVKARWERITGDLGGLLYQLKVLTTQPRIGSMYYRDYEVQETVVVGDFTGAASWDGVNPYKNTIAALNSVAPTAGTPTGPALWAAYAYLAQNASIFGSPTPQTGESAEWKNPMYQCIDGILSGDKDGNCQGNEFVEVPCAKNFIILLSDGQWNEGVDSSIYASCSIGASSPYDTLNTSADPVVPAYLMHKVGFTNTVTNKKTNVEALYALGLWVEGTGKQSLKNVAMYGGFDTSKTWPGELTGYPTSSCWVDDCSAYTHSNGKGSPCTALPASTADWDKDGLGVPDTFFEAKDALKIKQQIMAIIFDIMRKASSGTAVSVLSSSEGSGANLMQALFYPKRTFLNSTEVSWTSDLMNYWYYFDPFFSSMQIREDTIRDGADTYTLLDLKQDYITNFAFDTDQNKTLAHRWADTNGDGQIVLPPAGTDIDMGTAPIEETKAIWRAGFNLWWTAPTARNIYTSLDGTTLKPFTTANSADLDNYLGQTASTAAANATINYVRGYDCADASGAACVCGTAGCSQIGRSRTVTTGICSARKSPCNSAADCPSGETCNTAATNVWKMGDIISSTPRIMGPGNLNTFHSPVPYGYNDQTYADFIKSNDYKNRQLAFVGANDGMLHAFKLGKLLQKWTGKEWYQPAKQEGGTGAGGMGSESYAFIPKNALPYLQYLHDEDYCHIYLADGPTTLTDTSTNKPSACTQTDYWNCPKITTITTDADGKPTGNVDFAKTSWRTTLIGSMGIGGATCDAAAADIDRIKTPLTVSGNPVGWSSYYALDVTDQTTPQPLWEFSHPDLGVTNVGAGIVKVGGNTKRCSNDDTKTCSTTIDCPVTGTPQCVTTNGKWYAILASGSTGPIADLEFKGKSDKTLKIFVLDLKTGLPVHFTSTDLDYIDTGITDAFAGSISTGSIDLDKTKPNDSGTYQDDAIYIGYVQKTPSTVPEKWHNGGVVRLVINDDIDPNNWTWSKVFKDYEIGPVTTSVANLLDRKSGKVWLYFGEGRFFYKTDDKLTQRKVFGIEEPCYNAATNAITSTCATLELANLQDQTSLTSPSTIDWTAKKGWYSNMDAPASSKSAERVISNPTVDPLGAVFFLSFAPTDDICSFGGTTYLWGFDYKTGGQVTYVIQGKALIQVSTGEIKELKLADAFTENNKRKSLGFKGIPPTGQGIMIITNPSPINKFMHIQEQ